MARPSAGKGPIALIDRCPHRAAALSEGRMTSSGNLQCAYHGVGPEFSLNCCMFSLHDSAAHSLCWKYGASSERYFKALCHAGWTFSGETGDCVNIPQVSHGGTISGRTCATALPCVERQGILWVYPSPGATDPPVGNIAGENFMIFHQCVLASSDTEWDNSAQHTCCVMLVPPSQHPHATSCQRSRSVQLGVSDCIWHSHGG